LFHRVRVLCNTRNGTVANLEPNWSFGAPDQLSVQHIEARAVQFAQNWFQHLEARVMNKRQWQGGKNRFSYSSSILSGNKEIIVKILKDNFQY
jgi:hypothetical protein